MNKPISEKTVADFNRGDRAAYQAIYTACFWEINMVSPKMVVNTAIAAEISSDSLIKLWLNRGNFESMDKIRSFLFITTRNACLDHLKRRVHLKLSDGFCIEN